MANLETTVLVEMKMIMTIPRGVANSPEELQKEKEKLSKTMRDLGKVHTEIDTVFCDPEDIHFFEREVKS